MVLFKIEFKYYKIKTLLIRVNKTTIKMADIQRQYLDNSESSNLEDQAYYK